MSPFIEMDEKTMFATQVEQQAGAVRGHTRRKCCPSGYSNSQESGYCELPLSRVSYLPWDDIPESAPMMHAQFRIK